MNVIYSIQYCGILEIVPDALYLHLVLKGGVLHLVDGKCQIF